MTGILGWDVRSRAMRAFQAARAGFMLETGHPETLQKSLTRRLKCKRGLAKFSNKQTFRPVAFK
jgi:hypothetical protein